MSMRLQAISTLNNGKTMFTYTGNTAAITCLFVCIFLHQNFLLIPLSACVVTQSLKLSWGGQVINDLTTTRIFRIHIQWPESLAAGHRCVSQPSGPSWYPAVLEPSCYQNHWPVSLNQSSFLRQFANIQHHKHLNFTPLLVPQTNAITFSPEAMASLRQVELDLAPLQL